MNEYIRKNSDGKAVLDYALLDTASRANFLEQAARAASSIDIEDMDADMDAEMLEGAASMVADQVFSYIEDEDGNSVLVDEITMEMFVDAIISKLTK
jgi:hypothetical protein